MTQSLEFDQSIRCIAIDLRDCSFPATESITSTLTTFWEWLKKKISELIYTIKMFYYRTFKKREFGSFVHKKLLPLFESRDTESYNRLKRISPNQINRAALSNIIALLVQEKTAWDQCQTDMRRMLMTNQSTKEYVDSRKYPVSSKASSYASSVLLPSFSKSVDEKSEVDVSEDSNVIDQYKRLLASCIALVNAMASATSILFFKNQGDALTMNVGNSDAPSL